MKIARETIYAELFNRAQATPGFVTYRRKLLQGTEQDRANLPALAMTQIREFPQELRRGIPAIWKLTAGFVIYAAAGDSRESVAMTTINPLVDALEAIFTPDRPIQAPAVFTLGGLVSQCRLIDTVEYFEGIMANTQAVLMQAEVIVP